MLLKNILPFIGYVLAAESATKTQRTYSQYSPKSSEIAEAAATAHTSHETSDVEGAFFKRLVVIWLENTDFDKAAESEGLSYLAQYGITLDNYWALTHPSEPNYIAAVGGDYFALNDDRFITLPSNVSTIVDLLDSKSISWGEYQEHQPYTGFQGFNYSNQHTFANDYMRKHNPLISYESVTNNETRLSNIKNFTEFYVDLENETLPQWSFITPNMTNDGHDTTINVAATWTKDFLTPLLNNSYFMDDTLVLVTFDENETYADKNKVFALLLGGVIPDDLKGTIDSTFYDHYSEIATVEANWDLDNLGRHDANANVFSIVADAANVTNDDVDTTYKVNNHTYTGYLQDNSQAFPAPNITLKNKVGNPVLPAIVSVWSSEYEAQLSQGFFTSTTTTVTGNIPDATTTASSNGTASHSNSKSASASASASTSAVSSKSSGGANSVHVVGISAILGFAAALIL
ncbi:hypothetical protein WICMUC_001465 [Wickerhamomyces mucosus]|uniref:acid phosphatase n=1 Tax=Wickerhamomyces mucosus TaxID=1378264 RepID=A0A9P8PU41_9ASCO|nr:hypothetical protein WICMUC_001465 [Wickerhamomyces mucosus]